MPLLGTNILAYYKMDNGASSTDSVAGTYSFTNNTATSTSSGIIGYGLDFSTGDAYISTGLGIAGTADMSVSIWYKLPTDITSGGRGVWLHVTSITAARIWAVDYDYNAGTRRLQLYAGGTTFNYNVTLGTTWHHIVATRASGEVKLYLDGVEVITGTQGTTAEGGTNFGVGTGKRFGAASSLGDECCVWTRALTGAEILTLYNFGRGNQYPFSDFVDSESIALTEALSVTSGITKAETVTLTEGFVMTVPNTTWNKQAKSSSAWNNQSKS